MFFSDIQQFPGTEQGIIHNDVASCQFVAIDKISGWHSGKEHTLNENNSAHATITSAAK